MVLITSALVLRLLSLVRLYSAYLLLVSPGALLTQNIVLLLGSAMRLPLPNVSNRISATAVSSIPALPSALAAAAFTLLALSDLVTTTMPEQSYDDYWSAQSIGRTVLFFLLAAWVYGTKPVGTSMGAVEDRTFGQGKGDGLKNGLVFAWAFVEMTAMFWVMLCLRSEREERARKILREREEKRLREEREGVVLR